MKQQFLSFVFALVLTTAFSQTNMNWTYNQQGNYSGYAPSGKIIVKTDTAGNIYTLADVWDPQNLYTKTIFTKKSPSGLQLWYTEPGTNGGPENYLASDFDINKTTGQTFVQLNRYDGTSTRIFSYWENGDWAWETEHDVQSSYFSIKAYGLKYYDNKVYELIGEVGTTYAVNSTTKIIVEDNINLYYYFFQDTIAHQIPVGLDVSANGVYTLGTGGAFRTFFTDITRFNFSGHIQTSQSTRNSTTLRKKRFMPLYIKCAPSGDAFAVGTICDTLYYNINAPHPTDSTKINFYFEKLNGTSSASAPKIKEIIYSTSKYDEPCGLAFSSTGNIYTAGKTGDKAFCGQYNPTTFAKIHSNTINNATGQKIAFNAICAAHNDEAFVVGSIHVNSTNTNKTVGYIITAAGVSVLQAQGVTPTANQQFLVNSCDYDANHNRYVTAGKSLNIGGIGFDYLNNSQFNGYAFRMENSVDEIANPMTLNLYPNPTTDKINLALNNCDEEMSQITIVNMMGQVMQQVQIQLTDGANNLSFDCSNYAAGFYIVQIKTSAFAKSIQFIKQ